MQNEYTPAHVDDDSPASLRVRVVDASEHPEAMRLHLFPSAMPGGLPVTFVDLSDPNPLAVVCSPESLCVAMQAMNSVVTRLEARKIELAAQLATLQKENLRLEILTGKTAELAEVNAELAVRKPELAAVRKDWRWFQLAAAGSTEKD